MAAFSLTRESAGDRDGVAPAVRLANHTRADPWLGRISRERLIDTLHALIREHPEGLAPTDLLEQWSERLAVPVPDAVWPAWLARLHTICCEDPWLEWHPTRRVWIRRRVATRPASDADPADDLTE